MSTRYLPHIVYTLAITSISTHLLWQRKQSEDERTHTQTHITLLESTLSRLRSGERVPEREFERIRKFAREPELDRAKARGMEALGESIGWKEVLLGKSVNEGRDSRGESEWDRRDMENVRDEMEKSTSS